MQMQHPRFWLINTYPLQAKYDSTDAVILDKLLQ